MIPSFSIASVVFSGLFAGLIHVLSGPDHLAAIAPLALARRKAPWMLGARWGAGHAAGVALVAIAAWLLRELVPTEHLSSAGERLVGVMLIGIGIWGLRRSFGLEFHSHEHGHEGQKNHLHFHAHSPLKDQFHVHPHASTAVGILHGLAGASHFLGVLPALAMPTRTLAGLYLLAFGSGTVLAMAGFSGAISALGTRFQGHLNRLLISFSSLSILTGIIWITTG